MTALSVLIIVLFSISICSCVSFDEFVTINQKQKDSLDELKTRVQGKLTQDYMYKDIFLLTYLRDNHFNVDETISVLSRFLKWRKENQIDDIITKDFFQFDEEYRISFEGCDIDGNPVLGYPVGDWDFRRVTLSGETKNFLQFIKKIMEEGMALIRLGQAEGFNVTQMSILMDLKGIAVQTHLCPTCIPIFLEIIPFIQQYFTPFLSRLYFFNTPAFVFPFWESVKPLFSKRVLDLTEFHGTHRPTAIRGLHKTIHPSQLSRKFGGERAEGLDLSTIRASIPKNFLAHPYKLHLMEKNITSFCDLGEPEFLKEFLQAFHKP